jgi:hypothetical protein
MTSGWTPALLSLAKLRAGFISEQFSRRSYGTTVALPGGYHGDLGAARLCNYGEFMALVLMMVVLAFGLLYVAVVAEERQMQEATKPRKR